MMKQIPVLFLFLIFGVHVVSAQHSSLESGNLKEDQVKNAVYVELGGMGGIYSLNYERKAKESLWLRAGVSFTPKAYQDLAALPVSFSYLFGKKRNFLELGAGTTLFYTGSDNLLGLDFKENRQDGKGGFGIGFTGLAGYRFQPPGNFLFKSFLLPGYIPGAKTFFISAGISVGYSF